MEKYHFICQRWFALEKDDGKIERVIPVADRYEKDEFSYLLSKQMYHSLSDEHLWFSIFSRPPSNQFSRLQRCTCCFVLLFISMFFNIIYYDLLKEDSTINNVSLTFGPLFLTLQQVLIRIIIEFLSLFIGILLVQFFRRVRSRDHQISPMNRHMKPDVKPGVTFPWWCIIFINLC